MKKSTLAIASIALMAALGSTAFAQSPTGPADGTNRAAPLPAGSAARPGMAGEGSGRMAPTGADGTPKAPRTSGMATGAAPGTPKPGGEGNGAMAPAGADGTPKAPLRSSKPRTKGAGATPEPAGEGTGAMAPMGADGTPKSPAASAGGKESRKVAREARKARMSEANKSGEIPSPSVNPKSY